LRKPTTEDDLIKGVEIVKRSKFPQVRKRGYNAEKEDYEALHVRFLK
jgi:hypothetical protein